MAILIWGSLILLGFLSWATYQSALLLRRMKIEFNVLLSPAENAVKLVLVLVCLAIGFASGVSRQQLGWVSGQGLPEVWLGLALGVGIWVVSMGGTLGAVKLFGPKVYAADLVKSMVPRTKGEWFPLLVAMLPAVLLEELLFRSLLVGGFSLVVPALLAAAIFSTFFGLMHSPQGVLGVVATGAIGLLLSLVFIWRGSLLAPLVAHYFANVFQLATANLETRWLGRDDRGPSQTD